MLSVIVQHPALYAIGSYWLLSAFVGGMPEPSESSSNGYRWLYKSLHIIVGNIATAIAARYPAIASDKGNGV